MKCKQYVDIRHPISMPENTIDNFENCRNSIEMPC